MDHGLNNEFLYSACRLEIAFSDGAKTINGHGTAFFVKNAHDEVCLVTNRHVLDIDFKKPTAKYKDFKPASITVHLKQKDTAGLPTIDNSFGVIANGITFHSAVENDVACIKNFKAFLPTGQPQVSIDFFIPYDLIADKQRIDHKLSICDLVAFPGFPEWHDKRNNRPILRTGSIASDPRYDYSYSGQYDGACIGYEAFSYSGSSGSPVFAVQKGIQVGGGLVGGNYREIMLIGINAGHLPVENLRESHSGISYLYSSQTILDIIN